MPVEVITRKILIMNILKLKKISIVLFFVFSVGFSFASYLHEEIFFYFQKKMKLNEGFNIGCAYISIDSEKFAVKLIGGKKTGVKYYGLIPVDMRVDNENYVVLENSSGGELHLQSMSDNQATKMFKLEGLLNKDPHKSKDYSLKMIDGKYHAIKSVFNKNHGFEAYSIPNLKASITLKGILYNENLFKLEENTSNTACK